MTSVSRRVSNEGRQFVLAKAVLYTAVFATLLGIGTLIYLIATYVPTANLGQSVQVGTVSFQVDRAEWLSHDMGGQHTHPDGSTDDHNDDNPELAQKIEDAKSQAQVFAMPSNMMPGMPEEGLHRLEIEFTLYNQGNEPITYEPFDFRLYAENGDFWFPITNKTFGSGRLEGRAIIHATMNFDVDGDATGLYLEWDNNGNPVRIPLTESDGHSH
ncbi:MAG: DUF4352 domain-containing protein [Chloroflexi bacterium]|nr:MAG: DUF4352 domain-containing protein [Chloroflexota bacterium]